MKFIKTYEDTVCPQTFREDGAVLCQRIRYAGSVIAVEDVFAADMVKYKKGAFHPGPTHDIFELCADEGLIHASRPEAKAPPERLDLGAKLARAEKAVAPAQRAGAI